MKFDFSWPVFWAVLAAFAVRGSYRVCFLGLRPGRRNSGESESQKKISKEGDRYLRTMMVQGAHYILGPFGEDSDLRRWD